MSAKPQALTHKILAAQLVGGEMSIDEEIRLTVDQVLLQDATATLTIPC